MATLTYAPEHCPLELRPTDLQKFLKRARRRYEPARLRFFGVGEYGDQTWRPHYHVALFGASVMDHELLHEAWGLGHIKLDELNLTTANYMAGYICKKMTAKDHPELLGRHPEFARMSNGGRTRSGGIGFGATAHIAQGLTDSVGAAALTDSGDVPAEIRIAGKKRSLGRYLRSSLRSHVGWDSKAPKEVVLQAQIRKSLQTMDELRAEMEKRNASAASARARVKITNSGKKL